MRKRSAALRPVWPGARRSTGTGRASSQHRTPAPSPRDKRPTPAKTPPQKFQGHGGLETTCPCRPPQSADGTICGQVIARMNGPLALAIGFNAVSNVSKRARSLPYLVADASIKRVLPVIAPAHACATDRTRIGRWQRKTGQRTSLQRIKPHRPTACSIVDEYSGNCGTLTASPATPPARGQRPQDHETPEGSVMRVPIPPVFNARSFQGRRYRDKISAIFFTPRASRRQSLRSRQAAPRGELDHRVFDPAAHGDPPRPGPIRSIVANLPAARFLVSS